MLHGGEVRKMSRSTGSLPLYEKFHAVQGEGNHLGRNCVFLRTMLCPLRCAFCDSAGTFHEDFKPEKSLPEMQHTVEQMTQFVLDAKVPFVVITGGEPAIHNLVPLIDSLQAYHIKVHIETSGTYALSDKLDWITVSPKWDTYRLKREEMLYTNLRRANEWKLIITDETMIDQWWDLIGQYYHKGQTVWLHPEWSQRENPLVLNAITRWVTSHPEIDVRAGWQTHKLYMCDNLDPNSSKQKVPLGGNPAMGY